MLETNTDLAADISTFIVACFRIYYAKMEWENTGNRVQNSVISLGVVTFCPKIRLSIRA
jgi:hypothetical protein